MSSSYRSVSLALCIAFSWTIPAALCQQSADLREVQAGQNDAPRKWAVVIGINHYGDQIPSLAFCVNDAKLISNRLRACCGFDPECITLITDEGDGNPVPDLATVIAGIESVVAKAGPNDTVLIFFSGHGKIDEKKQDEKISSEAYLVLSGCSKSGFPENALSATKLTELLKQSKARKKVLILDCCHAGAEGVSDHENSHGTLGRIKGDSFSDASPHEVSEFLIRSAKSLPVNDDSKEPEGVVILASCKRTEQSYEWPEKKHGLFTWFIAFGLSGAADRDGNGEVDCDELYRFVGDRVTDKMTAGMKQTPSREVSGSRVIVLSKVSGTGAERPFRSGVRTSSTSPSGIPVRFSGNWSLSAISFAVFSGILLLTVACVLRSKNNTSAAAFAWFGGRAGTAIFGPQTNVLETQSLAPNRAPAGCVEQISQFATNSAADALSRGGHNTLAQGPKQAAPSCTILVVRKALERITTIESNRIEGRIWVEPPQEYRARDIRTVPARRDRTFRAGDSFCLQAVCDKNCYLTLVDLGTSGSVCVLLKDHKIAAGPSATIDGPDGRTRWEISGPTGTEYLKAFFGTQPLNLFPASSPFVPIAEDRFVEVLDWIRAAETRLKSQNATGWTADDCEFIVR